MSAGVIFLITVYIVINIVFLIFYIGSGCGRVPFTIPLFYKYWKLNWIGATVMCILAYLAFPIWGLWSLFIIRRK